MIVALTVVVGGVLDALRRAVLGRLGAWLEDRLRPSVLSVCFESANRGDSATLSQAIAALPPAKQADLQADRLELQGRAALLDNRPADALALFEQSAGNRQQALDYRGMARALSFAGDSAVRSNRAADAADLFLRAGRSSLLQGDTATALPLLKRAEDLARQTAQAGIVEEVARLRKAAAERTTRA